MNYANLKIYPKRQLLVDGTMSIYIRLTVNRKHRYITTGISVFPEKWDEKRNLVKRSDIEYVRKNKIINHLFSKGTDIITQFIVKDIPLTFSEFDRQFHKNDILEKCFFSYVDSLLESDSIKKYEDGTIRLYKSQKSKLQDFKKVVLFSDIDREFIRSYEAYMKRIRKNKTATIARAFKWLKTILNRAIDDGIIKDNPFTKYRIKIPSDKGERVSFSIQEIERLIALFYRKDLTTGQQNVLQYFLFACFTGLSYSDLANLTHREIKEIDGKEYIETYRKKTGEKVVVPLTEKAKAFIPEKLTKFSPVFKMYTDQASNRNIKQIVKIAGINKNITFHCSRHTFATVGFNRLGIPIEVISKILGHSDVSTTMIYTKIDNEKLREETMKWDTI